MGEKTIQYSDCVTLGHTGTLIRISSFPYFQSQPETQPEVDVMRLREAAIYKKSHTEHLSFLLISETFLLFPFHFPVLVLQIYMYLVLLT